MSVSTAPTADLDDAAIERIAEGMIACTLPAAEWTHSAHWATALWLIARRPDLHPPADMPSFIRRYNEATGGKNTATSGYHETITQASLCAGLALLAQAGEPVSVTLRLLLASPLGRSNWLLAYWSKDRLMSEQARREWVAPDLAPFAFPEFPPRED
ncbi:MAG: hypothetical protein Q8R02_08210 [Hyphomonadaceae bacterium]|nr:hypothetical protein [Hyphomonadaceae bacterium]